MKDIRKQSREDWFKSGYHGLPIFFGRISDLLSNSKWVHISHKSAPLKTNKQNNEKQISSQSYTNSEGRITANEYSVKKGKEIQLPLTQALEAC
jgi:hypothetical protein